MKVAVLGSGVVGVTTAYYLAKAGHEVTVYDRQPGPALETSYGNAGEISPGYSTPVNRRNIARRQAGSAICMLRKAACGSTARHSGPATVPGSPARQF